MTMSKKELNDRLMRAIQNNNLSEVKYLVGQGADDATSAFYAADYLGNKEIVNYIIDHFSLNVSEMEDALSEMYKV